MSASSFECRVDAFVKELAAGAVREMKKVGLL
jgi:hypothetical protein